MAALPIDAGDKDRALALETAQKTAATEGAGDLATGLLTTSQYTAAGGAASNWNKGQAAALFSAVRAKPWRLPVYNVGSVPAALSNLGALIFVSNGGAGKACVAFSDGTFWRRVDNLAPISIT